MNGYTPYTQDEINAVRRAHQLEAAIQSCGLTLRGAGRYLRCVQHDSLVVDRKGSDGYGSYFWNSRGEAGDVITWTMHRRNLSFPEAMDYLRAAAPLASFGHSTLLDAHPETPPVRPELPQDLHVRYHRLLLGDAAAQAWWLEQGIGPEAWARFLLGVCPDHPFYHQLTYTIPVFEDKRLVNIRHRLSEPPAKGDKYRPHMSGLGSQLFNGEVLTPDLGEVILVAGEKKAVVLWQYGLPAVSSTAGCQHFPEEWVARLRFCKRVYLCFDPGEDEAATHVAARIGPRALVCKLPAKPDDYLLRVGREEFLTCLEPAPAVHAEFWPAHPKAWGRLLR